MKVVVTGGAGFIGSHLSQRLLEAGHHVIAIDSMNPYYDIRLKQAHLAQIQALPQAADHFQYHQFDLNEADRCASLFDAQQPEAVVHLAAQAGVRYCEAHPEEAEANNIRTTRLLLELAHRPGSSITQFLFASSSSIYGTHPRPWKETYPTRPEGIYGMSKFRGEEMCASFAETGSVAIAAMRFFTVYGPFGRPDMAPAKFMDIIHRGKTVPVYGDGSAIRDFTYVEDIVQGIDLILQNPSEKRFEVYNLGKGTEVPNSVLDLIQSIETNLGKRAIINFTDPVAGDVPATQADITKAQQAFGYNPRYTLEEGIRKTVGIYFRHLLKHVVALVIAGNDSEALRAQCDQLAKQDVSPALVLVVDQAEEDSVAQANRKVAEEVAVASEYVRVGESGCLAATVAFFQAQLAEKATESWEEASNVFVMVGGADVASLVEQVSSSGWEVVGSPAGYLVRLDAFLTAVEAMEGTATPEAVLTQLQGTDNLRIKLD